jgi:hypothetical protein
MRIPEIRKAWAATLIAVFAVSALSCGDRASEPQHRAVAQNVTVFEPTDLSLSLKEPLTATLRGPGGVSLVIHSFPSGGRQSIRMVATRPGNWTYSIANGHAVVSSGRLDAKNGRFRGIVRPHGHALAYDDGSPFVAIGENRINIYDRSWNWRALSPDEYLQYMAAHGMTVLRVFIVSDVEDEQARRPNQGVLEPTLGQFDEGVARQFDEIFRSAQKRGIYVVLVAFALGFSEADDWKSWQDNPYSKARGGPAASRYDFFDSPAARASAAGRIRYLAARYGAFPNLLAIDLLNEPEWDGAIPEVTWTGWAEAMAREWDRADPYDHPVTVGSVGLHWNIEGDERNWWSSTTCAIVQWHLYGPEVYEVHALAAEMTRKVRETWVYGKPILVGEFAYGGEPKPDYDHTHVGLWSAAFSGAGVLAHSAPAFNVDSDELMVPERARHFRVLRQVLSSLPVTAPAETNATLDVSAWALVGADSAALWLLAPRAHYGARISGVRVSIPSLRQGSWHVRWLDDVSGALISESDAVATPSGLALSVPAFSKHTVAQLQRRP